MYANIKLQIFRKGIHQNQLAQTLGMDETLLSKIIRGYREPSEVQRKQLADCLNASEQWLFEKSEFSSSSEVLAKTELRSESGNDRD
jgi:transcriptional regulator with XRE-family HTH domain